MARRRAQEDRSEIRSTVMLGKPVVRGTRISVEFLLEKLSAGQSIDEVRPEHPKFGPEDIPAALAFPGRALGSDEILSRIRPA